MIRKTAVGFEGCGTSREVNRVQLPEISVQKDMLRVALAPCSITTFVVENVTVK